MLGVLQMEIAFDLSRELDGFLRQHASGVDGFSAEFDPQVRAADERFGDFQANGVLPYAKKNGCNPRELAQRLLDHLPASDNWTTSLAGPGFINFKLSPEFLLKWTTAFRSSASISDASRDEKPCKVVVDFSSPNTAKQMHVGHIRSTIIGESLSRMLAYRGHSVVRDNHLGDWGTQFGILLLAIKREGISLDNLGDDPIAKLEDLYRHGNAMVKEDESALEEARQ